MRPYGSVIVGTIQQGQLEDGALLDIAHQRVSTLRKVLPAVGDLLWVKEDFVVITSRKAWAHAAHWVFPGPRASMRHIPEKYRSTDYLRNLRSAVRLERADSRATLEVLRVNPDRSLHCRVHMQQVDVLLKARAA